MSKYLQIIGNNRLIYAVGILVVFGIFLMKWLLKTVFNQEQDLETTVHHSQLEQSLKDWAFYRHILRFFLSPITNEDLMNTEIGVISELNDILIYLEEWGGLSYTDGFWLITEKGKKILEKYGSVNGLYSSKSNNGQVN